MGNEGRRIELFVAVKGHAFARDAFEAMLRASGTIEPTMVDQPAAAMLLNPHAMRRFDAILLYYMPGLDFRVPVDDRPAFVEPDAALKTGFEALLAEGKGIVALHHAIAGWPAWPAYAEALGGIFLYKPAVVRGVLRAESGYAERISYGVRPAACDHPVLEDLPERFQLTDELYSYEVFDDAAVIPLLHRDPPGGDEFYASALRAVRRLPQDGVALPAKGASAAPLGWAKAAGASPLVYLQPGDGPDTYANPHYRLLIENAVRWVASDEARAWARSRSSSPHTRAGP